MIHYISRFIAALALLATAQGAWADTETVSYIDADGNEQTATATVLTGNEELSRNGSIDLAAGWYVVKGNISYTNPISYTSPTGTIHIILADGAHMSVEYNGNDAIFLSKYYPLAIYGQSAGTGRLSVTSDRDAIFASGGITINGGIVSATSTGNGRPAINANNGAITINGGQVTATPGDNAKGIVTEGTITLGLRSTSDFITANGYYGTVNIKDGQALKDPSGNIYYGTLTDAQKSAIANVTLQPATQAEFIAAALPQTAADTYTISDAAGWDAFCLALQDNDTWNHFSDKTVQLGADITVTRMAGGSNHAFTGTFDGGDHTLTLAYGTADAPIDAQFVAPFVETASGTSPVFRNLTIGGTIYDGYTGSEAHNIGGLIGHLFGNVTIEHCTSLVEIHAKVGAGGFVGLCEHSVSFTDCHSAAVIRSADGSNSGFVAWSRASEYTIAFTGCLFDGKLLQQNGSGSYNGGFIGWTGATKTVTITNSLCAPAPLADGETMASSNSATFARGWNATTKATNSYYTAAIGDAQGKATHTVAADADVTIGAIALTGTATQYTVSGITAYSGGGLQRGQTLYYGSDDQLSLTLSNSATAAPQGYQYGYTASAGTLSGTTLTMPDENVTISVNTAALRSDGLQHEVNYMTADGTTQTAKAIALDGHEAVGGNGYVHLVAGTYYVGIDITYANQILTLGDVTLILADRKTMTLNGNTKGIYGASSKNLTIYGQSLDDDAGTLLYDGTAVGISVSNYEQHSGNVRITTTGTSVPGIVANVTLLGGTLTVNANGNNARAISGTTHSILGGQLTATAPGIAATGIYATASSGTAITLGWTRPADRITVSSIITEGGTVAVKDGQALTDGSGNIYTGTLTDEQKKAIAGKTLQPWLVLNETNGVTPLTTLAGQANVPVIFTRTFSANVASTICLPFAISAEQATAAGNFYTFAGVKTSGSDWVVTMQEDDPSNLASGELAANTPYLFMPSSSSEVTFSGTIGNVADTYTAGTTTSGDWTYEGTYKTIEWSSDPGNIYGFASGQAYGDSGDQTEAGKFIRVHTGGIRPFRAYLQYSGAGNARALTRSAADVLPDVMTVRLIGADGQTTAIGTLDTRTGEATFDTDAWYTLDGRRLSGQPTAKGIYIYKGKKVIIK